MTAQRNRYRIAAVVVVFVLAVTYLHYSTLPTIHALHDIYKEAYYIPILISALYFGLRGTLLTFLAVIVLYLPYMVISWTGDAAVEADKVVHVVLQGLFAFLSGLFMDRYRKRVMNEERDRYLSGLGRASAAIAHDLRGPIVAILGYAKRLEEGKGDRGTALRTIREAAVTMQGIVSDVLDFSKPINLSPEETDLREVVAGACEFCRMKAAERGVTLATESPQEPMPAVVDTLHLKRAMTNLINNAIEASDKGQDVTVMVSSEKGLFSISIRDSGSGIDEETIENIFVPFYTKKSSGTGLGLSIARKVVEGHNGRIKVSSTVGRGTEIRVELPRPGSNRPESS